MERKNYKGSEILFGIDVFVSFVKKDQQSFPLKDALRQLKNLFHPRVVC